MGRVCQINRWSVQCLIYPWVGLAMVLGASTVASAGTVNWDTWTGIQATLTSPTEGQAWEPGVAMTFSVSASDLDHWMDFEEAPANEGVVGDSLLYTWSVTAGTLTGSGASVTWTAPDTIEGDGLVTVTVTVDDEAIVPAGDNGSRDDGPVTLSATMIGGTCPSSPPP